jgi:D-alanyl-D-alanine carboxypeptidase
VKTKEKRKKRNRTFGSEKREKNHQTFGFQQRKAIYLKLILFFLIVFFGSCLKNNSAQNNTMTNNENTNDQSALSGLLSNALINAKIPHNISVKIQEDIAHNPSFILELFTILQTDPYLWVLVDKEHTLDADYEPDDLVELVNKSYRVNRAGMTLRKEAEAALEEMAAAARADSLTLLASSAYRSYQYQQEVYERNVRSMGQEEADKVSARPGHSQHQLGLVIDFGSIDDSFARTNEGKWLLANASHFGWSLSFPQGYEEITGYSWESWHYRYVGTQLAAFINNYFGGIQQYALKFIHEFQKQTVNQ